ncbi:MAG TPA: hypothetical protein VGO78_22550 [Acidimicrobiales bacterium]|nr:hypothetical protein [Acidimicrobiales bacterium]
MLLLHEVHRVVGRREKAFEAAYREWMGELAAGDDGARLLWFLHLAHGTGPSYQVVTVTGLAGGAAWERLADRVHRGDLRDRVRAIDATRHDVQGRLLLPLDFSPLDVDLAAVPTDGRTHDPSLYMEDTMWPKRGRLDDYVTAAGAIYSKMLGADDRDREVLLQIAAAGRTMAGAGRHPEVTLLQKVVSMPGLVHLLTHDLPESMRQPGRWMHDALGYRDQWRSKLLRTATWSPLW